MLQKIKKILRDQDERNLIANIGMAFAVKGLALLLSFFSMPLYIRFFDNEEVLGLWYTILSVLAWINMCDLGLGNGLRNRLTEALATGDTERAKKLVSSAYAVLTVGIIPVVLVILALVQNADLNAFFNIPENLIPLTTLRWSVALLLVGVAISFVLRTINVLIYAIQKASINNIISLITSAMPLLFVAFFRGETIEKNLLALTVVHILAINLPLLVATFLLFRSKMLRKVAPTIKSCSLTVAKDVLGFGLQFFFAQVFFMALTSTNEIIITKMFSSADVVPYSIYYRLFTVIGSLFMLALTPLWSKVTKDLAQKKYKKIIATNRVLYGLSALAALAECVMVLILQFVVNLWLGEEAIEVDYLIGAVFAFYGSFYIFNVVLTTIANGIGQLRTQIVFYGLFAALKIPVLYLITQQFPQWYMVVFYNGVALAVFCVFQLFWVERMLKRLAVESTDNKEK